MESARFANQAYLLRLWQVEAAGTVTWRASLQSVDTGRRQGFEDLEGLIDCLRQLTQAVGEEPSITEASDDMGEPHL